MEIKKYPEADIAKKSNIYFQIGLVIVLGLCLVAFEWKTYDEPIEALDTGAAEEIVEEMTDITRQNTPPPPPPPPPPQTIEVVDDNEVIENEQEFQETEINQETVIEPVIKQVEEVESTGEEEVFMIVEDPAEFPGGVAAMYKFINSNIQYPLQARENNVQGRVTVNFVVGSDGSITQVKVVSKPIGFGLEEEAIRVVKMMPKWKPGKQRGRPVKVYFNLPISFKLN